MGTFTRFDHMPETLPAGDAVVVGAWSGNVHPYRAAAYRDGRLLGRTGFCLTAERAVARAEEFLAAPAPAVAPPAAPAAPAPARTGTTKRDRMVAFLRRAKVL